MATEDVVSYEVVDHVAIITIERPEQRNAMSMDVFDQLRHRAEQAGGDPRARAVLVRGAGGNFSSGIDISTFAAAGDTGLDERFIARLQDSFTAFEEIDKPVIAAIEGYCYGGGIQLAVACHVRAVAPTARLSVLERKWALIPDLGGTVRLPRLVGLGRATEMTLTARVVDADEALRIGLAEIALDADDPQADALRIAKGLADAPWATAQAPRLIRENFTRSTIDGLAAERETQLKTLAHPDFMATAGARFGGEEPSYLG